MTATMTATMPEAPEETTPDERRRMIHWALLDHGSQFVGDEDGEGIYTCPCTHSEDDAWFMQDNLRAGLLTPAEARAVEAGGVPLKVLVSDFGWAIACASACCDDWESDLGFTPARLWGRSDVEIDFEGDDWEADVRRHDDDCRRVMAEVWSDLAQRGKPEVSLAVRVIDPAEIAAADELARKILAENLAMTPAQRAADAEVQRATAERLARQDAEFAAADKARAASIERANRVNGPRVAAQLKALGWWDGDYDGDEEEIVELAVEHNKPRSHVVPEADDELGEGDGADDLAENGKLYPGPTKPLKVARRIVRDLFTHESGTPTLVFWNREFFAWSPESNKYVEHADVHMRSIVYKHLARQSYRHVTKELDEVRDFEPTPAMVNAVLDALAAEVHLGSRVRDRDWLDGRQAGTTVVYRDCSYDVDRKVTVAATPELFNLFSLPFDFDPDPPVPVMWLDWLASLWPNDPGAVKKLQEFFGYVISGDLSMDKMLLMVGPSRSGKGTIAKTLRELVGPDSYAGPTLSSFGERFLDGLIGKTVAVIDDARKPSRNEAEIVERLLAISSGATLSVEGKMKKPIDMVLPCRIIIQSNEVPKFAEASGALAGRFEVLQLTVGHLGREDRTLLSRFKTELPGILNWALEGLDRLRAQGHFTVSTTARRAERELLELGSPVRQFVAEACVLGETMPSGKQRRVSTGELYGAYQNWCGVNGVFAKEKAMFSRELTTAFPAVTNGSVREGKTVLRGFVGIGLES